MSKERYCFYCHKFKPDEGFKRVSTPGYPNLFRYMCPPCQEKRDKFKKEKLSNEDSNHQ